MPAWVSGHFDARKFTFLSIKMLANSSSLALWSNSQDDNSVLNIFKLAQYQGIIAELAITLFDEMSPVPLNRENVPLVLQKGDCASLQPGEQSWSINKQEFRHSLTHGQTVYPSNVPVKSPGSAYNCDPRPKLQYMTYNFLHQKYTNKVEIKYKNTINCKVINVCSNKLIA